MVCGTFLFILYVSLDKMLFKIETFSNSANDTRRTTVVLTGISCWSLRLQWEMISQKGENRKNIFLNLERHDHLIIWSWHYLVPQHLSTEVRKGIILLLGSRSGEITPVSVECTAMVLLRKYVMVVWKQWDLLWILGWIINELSISLFYCSIVLSSNIFMFSKAEGSLLNYNLIEFWNYWEIQ